MPLTKYERKLLSAVINPAYRFATWTDIVRRSGMRVPHAMSIREILIVKGLITVQRVPVEDRLGRSHQMLRYFLGTYREDDRPFIEWCLTDRTQPPPPLFTLLGTPKGRVSRCPGKLHDMRERVIEALLRNPGRSWRDVIQACGSQRKEATAVRDELCEDGAIERGSVYEYNRAGRMCIRPQLFPHEDHALVRELRKRYGIALPPIKWEWRLHWQYVLARYPGSTLEDMPRLVPLVEAITRDEWEGLSARNDESAAVATLAVTTSQPPSLLALAGIVDRPVQTLSEMIGSFEDVQTVHAPDVSETMDEET